MINRICAPTRLAGILALLLAGTSCTNFHVVDPTRVYRSAQLDGDELERAIHCYGIRTVINLRGENSGKDWYDAERDVTERLGVEQVDISMSAQRLPHRRDLIALLDVFRDADRPILIHCQAGADRTGEASAIYQMEYMGYSKAEALEQLTSDYWHFSLRYPAKRYFVKMYEGEEWARTDYDPCATSYPYYDQHAECPSR